MARTKERRASFDDLKPQHALCVEVTVLVVSRWARSEWHLHLAFALGPPPLAAAHSQDELIDE